MTLIDSGHVTSPVRAQCGLILTRGILERNSEESEVRSGVVKDRKESSLK